MADTDIDVDDDASSASGGSMVSFIVAIALLTLVSAGAGFATGGFLIETPAPPAAAGGAEKAGAAMTGIPGKPRKKTTTKPAESEGQEMARAIEIIDLEPVVTNLARPEKTWVRIEASIELVSDYDGDKDLLSKTIAEDLLMFTRTLSLASIAGSSGIAHYKEDISERARIRSGGAVNQVLLRMLVVE